MMANRRRAQILLTLALLLLAGCGGRAARLNERGNEAFVVADYAAAQSAYTEAIEQQSDLLEAQYNLANALQAQMQQEEAARRLEETALIAAATPVPTGDGRRVAEDATPALGARAWFNLGNLLFGNADYPGAAEAYRQALRLAPSDMDAKVNLELALRRQQQNEPSPTPTPSPTPEGGAETPTPTPSPTPTPEPPAEAGTPSPEPAEPETPTLTPTPPETPTPPSGENGTPSASPTPGEGSPTPAPGQAGVATPVLPGDTPMTAEQALRLLEAAASEATSLQEQVQRGLLPPSGIGKDW